MNEKIIKPLLFLILVVIIFIFSIQSSNAASFNKDYFYEVDVTSVYDGDTFSVETEVWPQHFIKTNIRLYGIDTPEKTWRAKCEKEKELALIARSYLMSIISNAENNKVPMIITYIDFDKYKKRYAAKFIIGNKDVSKMMIESGHAVEYYGKGIKKDWCL